MVTLATPAVTTVVTGQCPNHPTCVDSDVWFANACLLWKLDKPQVSLRAILSFSSSYPNTREHASKLIECIVFATSQKPSVPILGSCEL